MGQNKGEDKKKGKEKKKRKKGRRGRFFCSNLSAAAPRREPSRAPLQVRPDLLRDPAGPEVVVDGRASDLGGLFRGEEGEREIGERREEGKEEKELGG